MTDEQMKKLLEEDTGEVPERFHQAMLVAFGQIEDEPFDGTELPISVEAAEKPRRPRHVPRQGGRFRRMMLVMLITLGLLGGLAVATTANPRLLEVFWGKDFEPSAQASAYIARDLAEVETNGYRVRVEEAVYDGMTLYVRYSIRDMSCDHLLGETNVDTGRRMLNEQEITAFDHAPVGWWTDNLWINGQNVDMPGLSGGETWAGDENGEIVVSEMYRLDQVGVFLSGDVQIDLPIGEKQHYDYEMWQSMLKEDGTFRKPDAGLVSFTLNCDAPVTHYADGERVILPDGTAAWVESADDTPVKLYVTVRFEISDAQREAFRAENGEGYVFPDGTVMPWWMRTGSRCGRILAMAKATGALAAVLRTMCFRTRMRIQSRCILRRRWGRTARIWRGRFHSPCGSEQGSLLFALLRLDFFCCRGNRRCGGDKGAMETDEVCDRPLDPFGCTLLLVDLYRSKGNTDGRGKS